MGEVASFVCQGQPLALLVRIKITLMAINDRLILPKTLTARVWARVAEPSSGTQSG